MTYENIKSIILTILVLVSLLLTWNIWTYQPAYEYIGREELIQDVAIKDKYDISTLIRPMKLLFHHDGIHYGTEEQQEIERLVKEIKRWRVQAIEQISPLVAQEDFTSFMHGKGKIEVVLPDEIPLSTLNRFIQFQEDVDFPNVSVDRVVIDVDGNKENPTIHLVNYDERLIYRAFVHNLDLLMVDRSFFGPSVRYDAYRKIDISPTKDIFAPFGEKKLNRMHYFADLYSPENFKNALFSDPSRVTKEETGSEEVYTDGYRLMTIDQNYARLQYVNPVNADAMNTSDFKIIESSIDFINEHSGWTDKYLFAGWKRDFRDHTSVFRLHVNGYPVINTQGLTEIVQIWRNNEIYEYVRPLFELKYTIRNEVASVTLPNSNIALAELKRNPGFEIENLQDLRIGYELKRDTIYEPVFILEPIWMYQYRDNWYKISFQPKEDLGGM
ncbi:YycH family regulatory protein [Sutcliffiella cohnii]|uniref:Regulatory protein YycH domain-containing protein n=1 Tax=Sutcliffiella cohnii TaxID=33932 RepID=A0A223KX83_9BACI|nr:two-component system activity regulator YycH [Sutcliffiella cohnii]AST93908.1 hypothetical protein BC6307_22830 [Sutcliffiella cohnii]MED4015747.1 two-component system activity regulator YycH [Sutcliffiella cohnii]